MREPGSVTGDLTETLQTFSKMTALKLQLGVVRMPGVQLPEVEPRLTSSDHARAAEARRGPGLFEERYS